MLTVEPMSKLLAALAAMMTRLTLLSALVTGVCEAYCQQPPSTSEFLVAHLTRSMSWT